MIRFVLVALAIAVLFPYFLTWYWTISINEPLEEYDFIIVGAGTTGSVIANRLTEIPNVKVLVLEAGGEHPLNLFSKVPLLAALTLNGEMDWKYNTEPQRHSSGAYVDRKSRWPRGKVLGGTSVLNYMVYARGSPHDYDSWVKLGAKDWDYKSVLPYFKKSEHMASPDLSNSEYHGYGGPLNIDIRKDHGIAEWVFKAGKELGYKIIDYNSDEDEGFSRTQSTILNGKRHSAADAYLYPISSRKNLHVLTNAHVSKILFDEDKDGKLIATGVKYIRYGKEKIVRATNEVILSAGAVGTPHLLMLSGIGPKKHLENLAVNVMADLPGVGSNLQDHICMVLSFSSQKDISDQVVSPDAFSLSNLFSYLYDGSSSLGSVALDVFGYLKTNKNFTDRQYDYPDLSFFIQSVPIDPNDKSTVELYHDILNSKLEVIKEMQEQANKMNSKRFGDFNSVIMLSHPKSTGTLRLRSGDYSEHPAIDPNYLQDPEDVETLLRGLKFLEKLENTPTFLSFGMELMFAAPGCKKEIELGRTDNFYRCLARNHGMTMFHPCCTAKMGASSDKMAVTDHRLRVYKVEGLRVADASVMPAITSANTQAPSYMIGEKASDMIKEDWKLI